jgi:hypothetical protein
MDKNPASGLGWFKSLVEFPCSAEIVQDMFVKTLLGVFAVPEGKGRPEKI